jgi:desampylase
MIVRISSELHHQLLDLARATPDLEVCALLFGEDRTLATFQSVPNVAHRPECRFEIDPVALIAAHKAARGGGAAIIGVFHSHPNGRVGPSPDDLAAAEANGWIWLIAAAGEMTAWQANRTGDFDPLVIDLT